MKKYVFCLILVLCLLVPKTNAKYVIGGEANLKVTSSSFDVTETTNGPIEVKNIQKDFIEIKIKNNTSNEVKGEIIIEGVKLQDVAVASNKEVIYKVTLTTELFNKLKEKQIYPVKINYLSPYKVTKDVTTITVKKEEPGIWGKVKSMSLGSASELGIDYSKVNSSTNGEGVYLFDETKNDPKPVYFFRGTHNLNNNLIYGDFCWKIVRTTETGGVRVVYNGKAVDGKCTNTTGTNTQIGESAFNVNGRKKKYAGYMYGDDSNPYQNTNDSDIKKYIDNWYKNNIFDKGFEFFLDKGSIYCGDRAEKIDSVYIEYPANYRVENSKPTTRCAINDSYSVTLGNKKLKYPVSLLTADEMLLSGIIQTITNKDSYLYTNNMYVLLSPSHIGGVPYNYNVTNNGDLIQDQVYKTKGVRPAVTLKGELPVYSGDGSKDKPFVITTTLDEHVKAVSLGTDKDNGIDYTKPNSSTNGEGVYLFDETKSDAHPVYFYRGSKDLKNNLLYANFCWKIVRTTETGGVKILYSGKPVNGACTASGRDAIITNMHFNKERNATRVVGYMYGEESNPYENIYDSEIKKFVDIWYKENILDKNFEYSLDKKTIYCGDRTLVTSSQYAPYQRFKAGKPTLNCPLNDSYSVLSGNKKLTYPIALLSIDDSILSGRVLRNNTPNYLATSTWFWTISPANKSSSISFMLTGAGGPYRSYNTNGSVRPVLTLQSKILIKAGDGSVDKPFVI